MNTFRNDGLEQNYLLAELESLGLSTIRLNELNDNYELYGLVKRIKDEFLKRYKRIDFQEWLS